MSTPAKQKIGRYEAQEVIGTGNFATVHRAFDERLGDTVALKVLAENHSLDPDVRERFIAEGRFLRRAGSSHLVQVFDMGETERDQPFLVLEHADHGTLAARVAHLRSGPGGWWPDADGLGTVARSLAAAVEALHEADLVHRDLSPGNVLLKSRGPTPPGHHPQARWLVAPNERLMLADLGLCKDLAAHSGITAGSGTDGFRPPEQRDQPAQVDARADLWALSALLVWLATGQAPGDRSGEGASAAAADVVSSPGLPHRLGGVLARSLSDDPASRHPDVRTWLADVQEALAPPPTTAEASAPVARPAPRTVRQRLLPVAVPLAVGLAVGAGLALVLSDRDSSPSTEVTELDGGLVRVTATDGDAELALQGPGEVDVGDVAVFEVESSGVEDWVWIMPDGTLIPATGEVSLEVSTAGLAPVSVIGSSGPGGTLEVTHDLRAVD